jgi:hypothetical protein
MEEVYGSSAHNSRGTEISHNFRQSSCLTQGLPGNRKKISTGAREIQITAWTNFGQ